MKLDGKYSLNPARGKKKKARKVKARRKNPLPFTAIVANPRKRKGKKPGMWVAKKPRRKNPGSSRSEVRSPTSTRTATRAHTSGNVTVTGGAGKGNTTLTIRRNPSTSSGRVSAKKRRNPARTIYIYNPKARKKKRRSVNPLVQKNTSMKKSRRRRGKSRRSRNPVSRRGARRRNSARRRSSGRRRNPIPMVKELFPVNTLAIAGSAVVGGVIINTAVNYFATPKGTRTWVLPGINIAMLASQDPAVRATFYKENAFKLALYKGVSGALIGWALRNQAPRLGYGFALGSFIVAGNDALKSMNVVTADGTLRLNAGSGVSRNFSARAGAGYLPGTPTMFTNPAQRFLAGRNGAGARVVPGTMGVIERQTEGAFTGAN